MWLTWLADAANRTGYPVHEVAGWKGRGASGRPMYVCEGVVGHHTGTPATRTGDMPTLNILRDGHSSLAGPLSHLGLGRSGAIYVIAAGACNHAGVSSFAGFTSLNDKFVGIEMENPGNGKWTDAQLDCLPKLVTALLQAMGRSADRYASHRTVAQPAGRKDDPYGISDTWVRGKVVSRWATTAPPAGGESLPVLRRGDQGADVFALQKFLVRVFPSYARFSPTGNYGPQTTAAVRQSQANSKITGSDADGTIVGPRTNAALWKHGYRGAG